MTFLRETALPWLCLTATLLIPATSVVRLIGVGW